MFLLNKLADRKARRLLGVSLLAIGLTACGFHLRGNIPLADGIKNMHVSAPDGSFKDLLEDRLTGLGAQLIESPAAADVVLNVTSAQSSRTVGTLDALGKVNSYNVRFKVNYVLLDPAGKTIRPASSINESRRYDFDPANVVESESEEADLLEDMEQEAVIKLIRKLAAITDYNPNQAQSKTAPATN